MQLLVIQFTIKMFHLHKNYVEVLILNCITNSFIWNSCVTLQGMDYELTEYDTIVSKHVGVW